MRRRLLLLGALVLVMLLALTVWVGVRAWQATSHLQDAADRLPVLQEQLVGLDVDAARTTVERLRQDTSAATDLSGDPVTGAVAAFPLGGQNLAALRDGSTAVDAFVRDGGPGLLTAAAAADAFAGGLSGGDLDPGALRDAADGLEQLQTALERARAEVDAIDRRYLLDGVEAALAELEASLRLTDEVGGELAPGLLP